MIHLHIYPYLYPSVNVCVSVYLPIQFVINAALALTTARDKITFVQTIANVLN